MAWVLTRLSRTPPNRAPWQWAEAKRSLPKGSAEPGPFDSARSPWVRGITRAITIPGLSGVVVMMGSQMGKTDGVVLNTIGWQLDDDPLPLLYIGPTKKNAESVSADRIASMLRSVPSLYAGLAKGQRDKVNEKFVNGVRLGVGWAGSATELATHPAAKVFIDERDRMEDIKGEGDVNGLAEARVATFDGVVVTMSTPTLGSVETVVLETGLEHWKIADPDDIQSPTWLLWQEGSRHEYAWPCPTCREFYIPRFKLLSWPKDSTPTQAFDAAEMVCPHCGTLAGESQKDWMNQHGVFVAPGQRPEKFEDGDEAVLIVDGDQVSVVGFGDFAEPSVPVDTLSFWASGLCSNWRTFGHRARQFLRAVDSGESGRVQTAINTGAGELYRPRSNAPDWQVVANLREPYAFDSVPEWVQILLLTIDVQLRSLQYVIRGWGPNYESCLIRHGEIHGETRYDQPWNDLAQIMERRFDDLMIDRVMIDTGYNPSKSLSGQVDEGEVHPATNKVYEFCRRWQRRVLPMKGFDTLPKPLRSSMIDVTLNGKTINNGLQLWHVDTDFFKQWVYDRIAWPTDKPGRWRISKDATDDYCQQVVSEVRSVSRSGAVTWVKLRKANHALDCEMMQAALAHLLQLHRLTAETRTKYRGREPIPASPHSALADLAQSLNG